jgi:Ca2+-binding EF-hand superfamily protein
MSLETLASENILDNLIYRSSLSKKHPNSELHLPKLIKPSSTSCSNEENAILARAVSSNSLNDLTLLNEKYSTTKEQLKSSSFKLPNRLTLKSNTMKNSPEKFHSASLVNLNSSSQLAENIRAIYTPDVNKISLPVFGTRPSSIASISPSIRCVPSTPILTQSRVVDLNEYLNFLKEKLRTNAHEVKIKFRNADQNGKGEVTREALAHIIAAILGPTRPLNHQHFLQLLEKLGIKEASTIKYYFIKKVVYCAVGS